MEAPRHGRRVGATRCAPVCVPRRCVRNLWARSVALRGRGGRSLVVENVASKKGNYGFNARSEEYGDLVKMGVTDPTKVVRTALSNAASIASLLLTTDALVTEEPEEEEAPAAGGHGHHHH